MKIRHSTKTTVKSAENIIIDEKSVITADYGGAFDIDPNEFWTKDEIMELADEVERKINELTDNKYDIHYFYAYTTGDKNNVGVVELRDTFENEMSGRARIDMRRIRKPSDIFKYAAQIAEDALKSVSDIYTDLNLN